jgi:hypothetical protein
MTELKTRSKKIEEMGGCDGNHCQNYEDLGPYDLQTAKWNSLNSCRSKNIECSDKCKCVSYKCKNRGMSLN